MGVEFVKKTMVGYKTVDKTDPELSHIIMTKEDYLSLHATINQEKQRRVAAEKTVSETKVQCEQKLNLARLEANRELQEVKDSLAQTEREKARWEGLNADLTRICRERSNAERKLRPKKQHTGYVVTASQERAIRHKKNGSMVDVMLWETTIQTPYTVDLTEDQVRALVDKELWSYLQRLGFEDEYLEGFEQMLGDFKRVDPEGNTLLQRRHKANYNSGYWELILQHTKALAVVPADMRK